MRWDGPILTDSGGFQVFSLARIRKMNEEGVRFQSHIDGREVMLTPENSIRIQQTIGSDIMMVLDECLPSNSDETKVEASIGLTSRWAKRCKEYFEQHRDDGPTREAKLFGIVQGGVHVDLRKQSVAEITEIGFDGYAIGGLAVGESEEEMMNMTALVTTELPQDQPRYFMGGAQPSQLVKLVERGVDMFDCVIPTRNARHGKLFVWKERQPNFSGDFYIEFNIQNRNYAKDYSPIDPHCDCTTCELFSRAYLRHLFISEDPLAQRLASIHNLRFYMMLMQRLRMRVEKV